MADELDDEVLAHLLHIRRVLDRIDATMTDLLSRMRLFEATMGTVNPLAKDEVNAS